MQGFLGGYIGDEGFSCPNEPAESVRIAWSHLNQTAGFRFTSEPAETWFNVVAGLGVKRNGVFYRQ